jgi:hypothetical protein
MGLQQSLDILIRGLNGQLSAFHYDGASNTFGERRTKLHVLSTGQRQKLKVRFLKTLADNRGSDVRRQTDRLPSTPRPTVVPSAVR